jgi:hypothetical protein
MEDNKFSYTIGTQLENPDFVRIKIESVYSTYILLIKTREWWSLCYLDFLRF